MRIICLTPWFPLHRHDQSKTYILHSLEALAALGHEVTVLVTLPLRPANIGKHALFSKVSTQLNLHTCFYPSIPRNICTAVSNGFYKRIVNARLQKVIKQYRGEVILAHTETAGMSAVAVGQKMGLPSVVTLHGISTAPQLYSGMPRKQLFEYPLQHADRVVLVGDPLVRFASQFTARNDHFRVVYNGYQPPAIKIARTVQPASKKTRFISVCLLQEGKGIDLNLRALAKLNSTGCTQWSYRIVGDGPLRPALEKLSHKLGLSDQVTFAGSCDNHKVFEYLANADSFIMPSYREAFGIAYLEAMSLGLLTVGVAGQGPEAFIKHEQTGLLVKPHDIDDLAKTLAHIIVHRDKMNQIAAAGQQCAMEEFTWRKHAENLTKVFQEVIHP